MGMFPPKIVKIRKERVCNVCGEVMPVGTLAKSCAGIVDGKFVSYYEHADPTICEANLAKKAYA